MQESRIHNGTRVQCSACGRSAKEKRPLDDTDRRSIQAFKRAWRRAIEDTETSIADIADCVKRSPQYVQRCMSEAHDDAPRGEWLSRVPHKLFVAVLAEMRHMRLTGTGAAVQPMPLERRLHCISKGVGDLHGEVLEMDADGVREPHELARVAETAKAVAAHATALESDAKGGVR